jgi:mannosyl-3-phosphoglycerate phosphatase
MADEKWQWIIFTDLDGTLLNHHNYEYKVVEPLIALLQARGVPVILNSSKTVAELELWHERLRLETPIIAENGGVIEYRLNGQKHKHLIGRPYEEIRSFIKHLRKVHGWQFEGFGDWTVAEVMNKTGLKTAEAVKAKAREVSEPILWLDEQAKLAEFEAALAEEGLKLMAGGRFYHVMAGHDKADAMRELLADSVLHIKAPYRVIALGDSRNDLAMLQAADVPVLLPVDNAYKLRLDGAYYATHEAPWGWVEAIEKILNP